jgi:hypothetical protein
MGVGVCINTRKLGTGGLCLEVHMILGGEFILCSRVSKSWRIEMWVG